MKKDFPIWGNWVMDVTHEDGIYCFCPINDDNSIVVGMSVITDRCPGNLVGIFHEGGQDAVGEWEKLNPDWHSKYKVEDGQLWRRK